MSSRYQQVLINRTSSCWGMIKNRVPKGLIVSRPMLSLLYINYLLLTINNKSKSVIFADDASTTVSNHNPDDFKDGIMNILDISI
jgi:hypothetical protein